MKFLSLLVFTGLSAVWAQTPPAPPAAPSSTDIPEEAVVAVFDDGTRLTMRDYRTLYGVLPPQYQQMAQQNREQFLRYYALMRKMSKEAEKAKLDEQSPYKEAIDINRVMILMQAQLSNALNSVAVPPEDVTKYYDQHKENYKEVKVKTIYIAFSSSPPPQTSSSTKTKAPLTEDQAKVKALKLLAEIRAGADFVKLVKEYSDDETSKAKDGDLSTFRPSDNIPDAFRTTVFALKEGQVSEPVRQPNGFYLLLAERVFYTPLEQARDTIFQQVRQERGMQWMREMDASVKVDFPIPAFLGKIPAPPPAAK